VQRESRPQKKNSIDLEQIAAILLLFFLLFETVLISVTLIRSVAPRNRSNGELESTQSATEDSSNSNGEKDFIPVFSGGVIPQRPYVGSESVSLGDEVLSEYAILIDAESGEILASKNADVRFSPASMTKVMTLIVACENLTAEDLVRRVVYTQEIADYVRSGNYEGTSTSLPVESGGISCIGDEYILGDLLYGIGVASAADCNSSSSSGRGCVPVPSTCSSFHSWLSVWDSAVRQTKTVSVLPLNLSAVTERYWYSS